MCDFQQGQYCSGMHATVVHHKDISLEAGSTGLAFWPLQYLVGCLKLIAFALVLVSSYLLLESPLLLSKLCSCHKADGLLTKCSLKRL